MTVKNETLLPGGSTVTVGRPVGTPTSPRATATITVRRRTRSMGVMPLSRTRLRLLSLCVLSRRTRCRLFTLRLYSLHIYNSPPLQMQTRFQHRKPQRPSSAVIQTKEPVSRFTQAVPRQCAAVALAMHQPIVHSVVLHSLPLHEACKQSAQVIIIGRFIESQSTTVLQIASKKGRQIGTQFIQRNLLLLVQNAAILVPLRVCVNALPRQRSLGKVHQNVAQ